MKLIVASMRFNLELVRSILSKYSPVKPWTSVEGGVGEGVGAGVGEGVGIGVAVGVGVAILIKLNLAVAS